MSSIKGTRTISSNNTNFDVMPVFPFSNATTLKIFLHLGKRGPGGSKDARETIDGLGHILRLEVHRVIRRVLMNCVRPTPDSLFGDVPDRDSRKAAEIAKDREKWKSLRPSKHC